MTLKLLLAIVQSTDVTSAAEDLRNHGLPFTRVPSYGGLLEEPNSTFLLAVTEDRVPDVIACFERSTHARDVDLPPVLLERLADWRLRTVRHSGATILVADLEALHQT